MVSFLLIVLGIIGGAILGREIGIFASRKFEKVLERKLQNRAIKMMNGEIENKFEIDGKKKDVNIFTYRLENGKEETKNLIKK